MLRRRLVPWPWPASSRRLSRLAPPAPAPAAVLRVDSNNVARLGAPKPAPNPRQLLSLPPFPSGADPLPGRKVAPRRVTAVSWVKHCFDDVPQEVVQAHFNKRQVRTGLVISCDFTTAKCLHGFVQLVLVCEKNGTTLFSQRELLVQSVGYSSGELQCRNL